MKKEELRSYLVNHFMLMIDIVDDINGWCGELDHLKYEDNDENFFHTYFSEDPMSAVIAAQRGDYNYRHEYVRINEYGNLESLTENELYQILKNNVDDIIESLERNINNIDVYDDVVNVYFRKINN